MNNRDIINNILQEIDAGALLDDILKQIDEKINAEIERQANKENFLNDDARQLVNDYVKIDTLKKLKNKINDILHI